MEFLQTTASIEKWVRKHLQPQLYWCSKRFFKSLWKVFRWLAVAFCWLSALQFDCSVNSCNWNYGMLGPVQIIKYLNSKRIVGTVLIEFSTIPATFISESCIKIKMWSLKIKIFVGPQKVSWRPSRPLIKPFELPKRSVKIEIELIFLCSSMVGTGNVNNVWLVSSWFVGWCACLSGGKKCSFFGKFVLLWFLVTSVLRFFLLSYHQRFFLYLKGKKGVKKYEVENLFQILLSGIPKDF